MKLMVMIKIEKIRGLFRKIRDDEDEVEELFDENNNRLDGALKKKNHI